VIVATVLEVDEETGVVATAAEEEVPREVQASYGMIYALQRLHGLAFAWLKKISAQSIKHTESQVFICSARLSSPTCPPPHAMFVSLYAPEHLYFYLTRASIIAFDPCPVPDFTFTNCCLMYIHLA
jgi:hypothetical protein